MPERRRHGRKPVAIDVEIQHINDEKFIECVSSDVSLGGVKVRSPLGKTTSGGVVIVLSAEDRIFVAIGTVLESTVVVDAGEAEMRLRFDRLSPPTCKRLAGLLSVLPS